jgi:polyisoprenoid-binding protein YceI
MARDNRFRPSLLGGAALLAVATFSLVAAAKLSKTGSSTTTFKVAGPAGLNINGTTADMNIADDGTTVTITVPLNNVDTGIGLRNDHTKKALDTATYPNATLTVARAALNFPAAGADSSGDAKGSLSLHGKSKDVTFHYAAKNAGGTISVNGSTHINMNDFGITPPSYLGVSVKPDVDIVTAFQATN